MADEVKPCSPICSTFEALVVRCAVRHCLGEESGPFCWPVLAAGIAVFGALYRFPEHTSRCSGFTGIQKAVVDQTASRPSSSDRDRYRCKLGFGKCFGTSPRYSHWAGLCRLAYNIHFSSHITIQLSNGSLLLCRIREDNTSKWRFFWSAVSSWGSHLLSFFAFPICSKCQVTAEWLTLSSWAASCKRIGFDDALNWSLSTSSGGPLHSSSRF